jgi:hypothetical protein
MWRKVLAGVLGRRPIHTTGEAWAAWVGGKYPDRDGRPSIARIVFATHPEHREDTVLLCRTDWRLREVMYGPAEPRTGVERTLVDALIRHFPDTLGVAHRLPDQYAPPAALWTADVAVTPEMFAVGFNPPDHDANMLRVRFDLAGQHPSVSVIPTRYDPTAMARRRLDILLARGAKFIRAELAQANYQLYQPGTASAACMVMVSFDFRVSAQELRDWGSMLYPLKFTNPTDPTLRDAVWPLEASERSWYYHRRFRLPDALTGGRAVFLADLWVHRPFIVDGQFHPRAEIGDRPRQIPCLAEPNESGWAGIELVPHNEVETYRRLATKKD